MDSRRLDHVIQQLDNYSGHKKRLNSSSTFVICPYHSESTPSGRLFHSSDSKSPGFFKCYGCGAKARWDEVAPKLGLKPYKWTKPTVQYAMALRNQEQEKQKIVNMEFSDIPKNKLWRSIETNLLIDIGARRIVCEYDNGFRTQSMLWFPVNVKGKQRGFIRARIHKEFGRPSYLNSPGRWSQDFGLFPYDYAVRVRPKTVVLVEGPRDALRLLAHGIPAIAILGTQSWGQRKSQMVELTGAKRCVLCMDGDDAGLRAIKLIEPQLQGLIETKVFDLAGPDSPYDQFSDRQESSKAAKAAGVELWDPCNMPLKKVKELRSLCLRD
jgi:hypothetical protein